ncbi:hypothetical protein V6Z11_D12G111900 [Gossypium hirsutum]|uniref:Uncharacterized protein LOC107945554 n=1 Tax=Gossypium hirsutum TaxID=3635 RepID=A0A1U8N7Z5_GOSHI|nr:uncharacterized protein LOC107945554 isoform X1 [Gossypium hirsutum]XP_016735096.1 uncharacterized protein LOC107945554 isoform X1 [Gossypium hirsutum]XP_040962563.1 uncharacterized protein LOC107945554 isoform X1 [Gossypium hirsutum]
MMFGRFDNWNVAVNSRKPEVNNDVEEEMSVKHLTMKKRVICELQNQQGNPTLVGHSKKKSSHFRARGCKAAIEGYSQPSLPTRESDLLFCLNLDFIVNLVGRVDFWSGFLKLQGCMVVAGTK